jgi:AcrR family transcriptional regulator
VVRRHGWAGSPPADPTEARARIIEAATRCVDRRGAAHCTLSDVATDLGVTRQTVYRYFESTDALLFAVARVDNEAFVDDLSAHLAGITDPVEWAVEAAVTAIALLRERPRLTLVLAAGSTEPFARSFTSPASLGIGRALLARSAVDWAASDLDQQRLEEMVELLLRLIQSMIIDPPDPPRSDADLRAYFRRWLGPALAGSPTWPA